MEYSPRNHRMLPDDDHRRYVSNLESSHEELLIDLLARATEARTGLLLLSRVLEENCTCAQRTDLLQRVRSAERQQQAVIRKIEGDLFFS